MIDEAKKKGIKLSHDFLKECGKSIKFYPGVLDYFERINAYGKSKGVIIEHYLVSSGTKEIVEGCEIFKHFKKAWACEYYFDEEGNPFVPLVSTEGIQSPDKRSLSDILDEKLEVDNIIPGENVIITTEGNDITISTSGKGVLIDDLNTATAGVGGLDAHQGKVLKEMIPNIVDDVTSTSTTEALSANQGYVLNQKVVPAGGKAGQVLKKKSDASHSLEWGDAADPNAVVGDGSIKKIVEITYEDYKILEDSGEVDPNTEYHILDSLSVIDNLQETLDSLQNQITSLRNTVQERASKTSSGYAIVTEAGVMEGGKIIDFHSDFTTGNDFDTRLECGGHNKNTVTLPSESGTLALTSQMDKNYTDITSSISKKTADVTDLEVYQAIAKNAGGMTSIKIILRTETGWPTKDISSVICLPEKYKPNSWIVSYCRTNSNYSYPTWNGTENIAYMSISSDGWINIRTKVSGQKVIVIDAVY